jgi:hypothetical protein
MLQIVNVQDATSDEWDEMWRSSEFGTYFHSREWAEIWQSYTDGNMFPDPKIITFSDDRQVVLPSMCQNYYNGIIKRYAITGPPFMTKYGNWLNNNSLNKQHITLLVSFIMKKYKNLKWQLNPYDDNSKNITVNSKYAKRVPQISYIIDLTKGEEIVYANMKQSCRNHIKQGINNNLMVTEGIDINHWKIYFEIYQDTVKRWGVKARFVLGWKLFEILFYKNNPDIKLWLVWYKNIAIAGSITFYSQGKIIGWHMASLTEYRNLRPNHFLEYTIIKDGIAKKYNWYDLGIDGGIKGLENFKRSFGPGKKMCDTIIAWHPIVYYLIQAKNYIRNDKDHAL